MINIKTYSIIVYLFTATFAWQSSMVNLNADSSISYTRDSEGNSIADFSMAGFANGEKEIPVVQTIVTVFHGTGDQAENIQKALDSAGTFPLDNNGIRGAVLLSAGTYELSSPIFDTISGVILRGESDSTTILRAVGDSTLQKSVVVCGGRSVDMYYGKGKGTVQSNIISDTVYVGERSFTVENGSLFVEGDTITVWHPCTPAWVSAIGGGDSEIPWSDGQVPVCYIRTISKVEGNKITIDTPVFMTMVKSLSQAYIYKFARKGLKSMIGIENLRIDCINNNPDTTNENHPKQAIDFKGIDNGWVKNCTVTGFVQSGIIMAGSTRITVDSCRSIDPMGIVTGERFYNFHCAAGAQQILISNCYARKSRHAFVANGAGYSNGIAVVNCRSDLAYTSSEGHRWWSTGMLFDNYVHSSTMADSDDRTLGFYDRTGMGTQHGWGSAHCVAWNCRTTSNSRFVIQKPKTAQNWAIGCFALSVGNEKAPNAGIAGFVEGTNQSGLEPQSLYTAQLAARLKGDVVSTKELVVHQNRSNWIISSANQFLSVNAIDSKAGTLTLYSISGKVLKSMSFHGTASLSMANLPKGCVIVSIDSGVDRLVQKVLVR